MDQSPKRFVGAIILALLCIMSAHGIYAADKGSETPKPVEKSAVIPQKVFNAKTTTLLNGMQVVVVENNRTPVVTHMVWYKVGAADETPGVSGIAHFMEHLMFKGSAGLAPGDFSKKIRSLGGNDNAFTSHDYTAYFQSVGAEHLETVMRMEAGRMRGMNPPPDQVLSERKVILEERSQRTDNNPEAKFPESLSAALFVNHPYGKPVIGWEHEMAALTWEDAKSFYDRWYGPNNAILVVSGDVKSEDVFELAQKIYGPLESVPLPKRKRTVTPPLAGRQTVIYHDPAVREPQFQRVYRVPSYRQNAADSLALQVFEDIAGNGPTSRLYKSLVIDKKLATNAGLSYSVNAFDDAELSLYLTPAPGKNMKQIEDALDAEIMQMIDKGLTEAELSESLKRLQAEAIYARDSLSGPAMTIGYSLATGSMLDDVEFWPQNIAKVTAAQIQGVVSKYLDTKNPQSHYVNGYMLPAEKENSAKAQTPPKPKTENAP
jgi:zinc protease